VTVPDESAVQDSVTLAEQLPINRFSPDYYALQLGNHVLGGGFYATRLYRVVRQQAGYVYTIENSLQATQNRAEFSVEYGSDSKNVSKARALVERELTAMQKYNVSPAELQQAKALLLRQIPMGEASEDDVAAGIIARARIGLPLDEPFRAAKRYYAIEADQIRDAFAKWIDPSRLVQVVRGPAPE
jgi:zinc protease